MKRIQEMMEFIDRSPCNYLAVENLRSSLEKKGYQRLYEQDSWKLSCGGKYYVIRNDSAMIAFRVPSLPETDSSACQFLITASHSDSPCFKVKENPENRLLDKYARLRVEPYGGLVLSTWLDRPLSIAGRVIVKNEESGRLETRLLNIDRDLLIIPNQAIHMNREINNGYVYKKHIDMVPLWGGNLQENAFRCLLANEIGAKEEAILDYDLAVYNRMKCCLLGQNQEFIAGPRLDDLECAFTSFCAFEDAGEPKCGVFPVFCLYDNEEVGSQSMQGAGSTFLRDTLKRMLAAAGSCRRESLEDGYHRALAGSFLLSADNAHAVHPNFTENSDSGNRCYMNDGIVVKYQSSQKYASDAISASLFRQLARQAGAKVQTYMNRSDQPGGSTLGNISMTQAAIRTVDIGLAQLAMHSSYETAGAGDVEQLYKVVRQMYESRLTLRENEIGWLANA